MCQTSSGDQDSVWIAVVDRRVQEGFISTHRRA
jgi:hypothetical protein